jgi:hypothetical protein
MHVKKESRDGVRKFSVESSEQIRKSLCIISQLAVENPEGCHCETAAAVSQ